MINLLKKNAPEYKGTYEELREYSGRSLPPTKKMYYFKNGSIRIDLINPSLDEKIPIQRIFYTKDNKITCNNRLSGSLLTGTAKIGETNDCYSEPPSSTINNFETPYEINQFEKNKNSITAFNLGKKTFSGIEADCYRLERLSGETKVTTDYCISSEGIITFKSETRKLNDLTNITTLKLINLERSIRNEDLVPPQTK